MSLLLSIFTLILLSTATSKMLLYIGTYGLSRKRVYTLWLMALLAVYFIVQIVRVIIPRLRAPALIFAAAVLFIGVFLFADFDRTIAAYNVDAYLSGRMEDIDTDALGELSASAIPSLLRLYDEAADTGVRQAAGIEISHFLGRTQGDAMEAYGYGGESFNLAQARALKLVREHADYVKFLYRQWEFSEQAGTLPINGEQ